MQNLPDPASPSFPGIGHAVLLSIGMLMVQVSGGAFITSIDLASGAEAGAGFNPWVLGIVNVLAIGLALALGLRATRETPRQFFALRPFDPRLLPAIVAAALGLAVVLHQTANLTVELLNDLPGFNPEDDLFRLGRFPFGTILLVVVIAPLTEEYLFRGMVLRGLLAHHRAASAVWLTALLFGLVHANILQFFLGTMLGAVVGWWYVRTRSVGPGLIGHALFNTVGCCGMLFPDLSAIGLNPLVEPLVHQPWWLTVGGAGLTGLGLWRFHRMAPPGRSVDHG